MAPIAEEPVFDDLKRTRSSQMGQLTKLYREVEKLMLSYENLEKVEKLFTTLCDRFEQFKSTHFKCVEVCEDQDVAETLKLSYDSCQKNLDEFRERFSQWKADAKTPDDIYEDNGSIVVSTSSTSSSLKLKGAKAKRLVAAHKLKKLAEKHELERAQRQLAQKQEILEQQCELEQAELEESVWQDEIHEDTENTLVMGSPAVYNTRRVTNNESSLNLHKRANENDNSNNEAIFTNFDGENYDNRSTSGSVECTLNNRNAAASNGTSCGARETDDMHRTASVRLTQTTAGSGSSGSQASVDDAFQRLASTLHEGFNLPKPELLTFDGSPMNYSKFIKNFETNIECKVSDGRLKLSYLIQYCQGEAKYCIEDCVLMEPGEGYNRARDILYSRYGRPHVIARTYIEKLVYGPPLKGSDYNGLSKLSLEMQKCEITLSQLGFSSDIDNSENLRRIVRRLPMHMRVKWADIAHSINEKGREPRFSDLSKFVDERSRVCSSMYGADLSNDNIESRGQKHVQDKISNSSKSKDRITTLATRTDIGKSNTERTCICCSNKCFDVASCSKFQNMTLARRSEFVREMKLCYNCLKARHVSKYCRKPKFCNVNDCNLKHHRLLHSWIGPETNRTTSLPSVNCTATKATKAKCFLGIIPVTIRGKNGKVYNTYALLDDGADKSLCDERLLKTIGLSSSPVQFQISTVNSTGSVVSGQEVDLHVKPVSGDGEEVVLQKVWTVKRLPISIHSAPTNVDLRKIPYLKDIDLPNVNSSDVMILIGADSPESHIPFEVRAGEKDQPYAIRSRLGWTVRGPLPKSQTYTPNPDSSMINVNFGHSTDDVLQHQLERMWTSDFEDKVIYEKECMSVEDREALQIMEESICQEDGHYKLGLPWRHDFSILPDNIALAHVRLQHLKRKLKRDPTLHSMYTTTVNGYIEKGYAREISDENVSSSRKWYLPHHPVLNKNKPGKVRVVFDCAARYQGVSLNNALLQGPDFMNSLLGVIIRFRQNPVAISADIEAMFHQVRVKTEDCDSLRFLWWPNGDLNQEPRTYCMNVHLFGATSSPSCAAYALKRTARDNADQFDPEVIATVEKNFYVDDCLKSVATEQSAIKLADDLQRLTKLGGFRLTKWISNSREVLQTIPDTEIAPSVLNLGPTDHLPNERALGVLWNVNDDTIKFKVEIADKPLTRRGILSIVSSTFDPLGLVSPVTLRAKAIIQKLCREKIGWDDPIPEKIRDEWQTWLAILPNLEQLTVSRCIRPPSFGNIKNTQLHLFNDGSEIGYGACAYLRTVDVEDRISCSLVVGRSRLAPIKQISIPRLELSGAVVACRLYAMLNEELEIDIDQVTFWTDSTIVLGYIHNISRRFKTFVGNRLSVIHSTTSPDQWRHVDTDSNPADMASRGIDANDTKNLRTWVNGPEFLLRDPSEWPKNIVIPEISESDSELKKETNIYSTALTGNDLLTELTRRYSDWTKLKRAVAWICRFKTYCRNKFSNHGLNIKTGDLSLEEIWNAEHAILTHVQSLKFADEIRNLRQGKSVKKNSSIMTLNPVLHDGLIRIQGRNIPINPETFPVILPGNNHVTTLIIRHFHERKGHIGKLQVLAYIREKYWILSGPASIKRVIGRCIICKRHRNPLLRQQMAPLLTEQTTPETPPFTFVGIDYFGPMFVKSGKTHQKRYGCLFSCLTTRAVHLEVAHSLTTDSFISAFRRFTSRRGAPKKVYSDNGTNLVSGDRELRQSLQSWNQSKIGKYMIQDEITWEFNPPYASHRGGAWERMIRSARTILKSLVKQQLLNDEQLLTLMTEVERILNDRPITQVSNDPKDLPALTPSMLLLMKSNTCLPPGIFRKETSPIRRWWRQTQYLADVFWKRWVREYIPALQVRTKWQKQSRDLREGDVVLVADEIKSRGQWPLGRVININRGRDGHVRSCLVKSRNSITLKPITKLCLLESSD